MTVTAAKQQWIDAVSQGDVEKVRSLLRSHPELKSAINEPLFAFGGTALLECRRHLELVDVLLENGADLNVKSKWWAGGFGILEGVSPEVAHPLIERGATVDIWAAAGLEMTDRVVELLDARPELVRARGGDGKHAIHYARSVEMIDLLVQRGADVDARCIDHESTPVQYLVDNESVVRRLLAHGAEPDIFLASALGDVKMVSACIDRDPTSTEARLGAGVWKNNAGGHIYNWTLGHDATPHDVARGRGHSEALAALLERSSPEARLRHAIWWGDRDEVERLVESEPQVPVTLARLDRDIVARAAWWYRPEAVGLLLELGFDRHVPGVHDSTPLDRAAFHGYAGIVGILLDGDSNPPVARLNEFGGTPLEACIHGAVHGWKTGHPQNHPATIEQLLDAGSPVSQDLVPTGSAGIDRLLRGHLGIQS